MLNYILPPIVIVISVSALIMFLFRKAKQIPEQEFIAQQEEGQKKKIMSRIMSGIGQFNLKVLERVVQKLKLLSLRFHNASDDLFHSIHEKRQRNKIIEQRGNVEQKMLEPKEDDERKNEQQLTQPDRSFSMQTPKAVRPLIREAIVRPQIKTKEKSQLEEVLIKRIAINPKDIEAYERLGDYYLESENYQDSHECFKQVLKLSPTQYRAKIKIRRLERLMR